MAHINLGNKTSSKYDRLKSIINMNDPKDKFTIVNMLKCFKCWTMQYNSFIQGSPDIYGRFSKDIIESDKDFIEKLVLYSKGITYNFKLFFFN